MRKITLFVAVVLVLGLAAIVSCSAASEKFAAKVNGVGIKSSEVDAAVNNFIQNQMRMGINIGNQDKTRLQKDIVDQLIAAEVLYQESKKAKLGNLTEEIEKQFEGIKKGFDSQDEFKKYLKNIGKSEKDLKDEIRKGVYINAFLEKDVYINIVVTEAEKEQLYDKDKANFEVPEKVRASHILIRVPQDASEDVKKEANTKINTLRERAKSGEDFAELAMENSEDATAPRGGDLGYFGRGVMLEAFEEAAFNLEKDEISEVLETQFGYHIIKLLDRQDARALSYHEVKDGIERFLLNQRRAEALNKFIEDLKKTAKIKIF